MRTLLAWPLATFLMAAPGCRTTNDASGVQETAANGATLPADAVMEGFSTYCGDCHDAFASEDKNEAWKAITTGEQGDDPKFYKKVYAALDWDHTPENKWMPKSAALQTQLRSAPGLRQEMLTAVSHVTTTPTTPTTPNDPPNLSRIKLPPGFEIHAFAKVPGARSLTLSPEGTLYVGTGGLGSSVDDRVFVIPHAATMTSYAGQPLAITKGVGSSDLAEPNGVAFKNGSLYVAEWNRIIRYDNIEGNWTNPAAPVNLTGTYFNLQKYHEWKFLAFGPDGKLYTNIGSHDNIHPEEDKYASIVRLKPDGSNIEVFARGVRNTVGFDWHPTTKELWFTDNGRDEWGADEAPQASSAQQQDITNKRPPDELNRAPQAGMHFGFPYCFGHLQDPTYRDRPCSELTPPVAELDPHAAALGMRFYTGSMFPAEYRGAIFIAQHGSWNSNLAPKPGYKVVVVTLDANGQVKSQKPFAYGWQSGSSSAWGRPTDVLVMPDGALLVSDSNGMIYRISYTGGT